MDWSKIGSLIAAAERRAAQFASNLIQITAINRSTAKGENDNADGYPDAGQAYGRRIRRFQHFGFRSRPPKNTAAVMLLVGAGNNSEITIAEDDAGLGPDDLADGEVAIYSKASGAVVKIDANGAVTITAATGQTVSITAGTGAKVLVNGGGRAVAAQGDTAGPYPLTTTGLLFETQ